MTRLFIFALLCSVTALSGVRAALAGPVYDCTGTGTVYDSVANVVVTPRGSATCLVYDDSTLSLAGHLSAAAPLGSTNITSTTYDSAGRLVSDTGGFATTTVYDSSGRLATDANPNGTEQYFYDSQNRLTSESGPASITQTIYDASDRLASLTDSQGTTSFTYDVQGQLIEADNGALMTTFTYDALGRLLTETTTGPADITSYMYDVLGRLNSINDTLGNSVQFSYDAGGLLTQVDTNGSITTYMYDANGLLSGANDPGNTRLIYTAASVPEPSSIIGLGSALGLLVSMRRRLRRRSTQIAPKL